MFRLTHMLTLKIWSLVALISSVVTIVAAGSTFSPARPPSLPLAVKSPYLSTWQNAGSDDGSDGGYLAGQWTQHWSNGVTGWVGMIRVDGMSFLWMGNPPNIRHVSQRSFTYTSTSSVFTMDVAGLVTMTITFRSPITPNDMMRQSLVMSYVNVEVVSADGNTHDVQLYTDISAEWASGDKTAVAQWSYGVINKVAYHRVARQEQMLFTETSDQADWGNWYRATDSVNGLTHQSGEDRVVRSQFTSRGWLKDSSDTNYRAINNAWPVFGFAIDLGSVGKLTSSTLFSIALCQEQAIQFAGSNGTVSVPSLWTSYFSSDLDALSFFHGDYETSSGLSNTLDSQITSDSNNAGGSNYSLITSLSLRQTFGATQLAGSADKYYLFLKEISSNGNLQTVDVIFPAWPAFAYANPTLLKLLLDPLFEHQEAGLYPNRYSMHDLGTSYPNSTGHPNGNDEMMPLEECGDMLIMTLDYAQRANDTTYLTQHYNILKQWTGYLVEDALYPANQISTDDFAGALPNQTNLALKGMIGIGAMGVIAQMTGNTADASNFTSISQSYISQWQTLAINSAANPPYTTLSYGQESTHGLLYNLFGDAVLKLGLVPQSVYDMQSNFYPTIAAEYGVPLDTRHTYTKGDWEIFAAAVASSSTKSMFINLLANWINQTPTDRSLTDLYDTVTGDYPGITFVDRPVMGGTFAPLLLYVEGATPEGINESTSNEAVIDRISHVTEAQKPLQVP